MNFESWCAVLRLCAVHERHVSAGCLDDPDCSFAGRNADGTFWVGGTGEKIKGATPEQLDLQSRVKAALGEIFWSELRPEDIDEYNTENVSSDKVIIRASRLVSRDQVEAALAGQRVETMDNEDILAGKAPRNFQEVANAFEYLSNHVDSLETRIAALEDKIGELAAWARSVTEDDKVPGVAS